MRLLDLKTILLLEVHQNKRDICQFVILLESNCKVYFINKISLITLKDILKTTSL